MKKIFDGKAFDGWNISLPLIQGNVIKITGKGIQDIFFCITKAVA